jgi:hypothetical protein
MHEGIRLAVVTLDEAEALHRIEELHDTRRFLARQLALRATLGPLDSHRLAFDSQVCRRDATATIDERELERLAVSKVREARLLDRRNVNENVLASIVADDEAEALLRIEEFYDAFSFADDLRRHSATAAAAAAAKAAATAAAETATSAAAEAATVTVATTAAAAAEAITAAAEAAASATAVGKSTAIAVAIFSEKSVARRDHRGPPYALYRNPGPSKFLVPAIP